MLGFETERENPNPKDKLVARVSKTVTRRCNGNPAGIV
jgi:hypothetical protein